MITLPNSPRSRFEKNQSPAHRQLVKDIRKFAETEGWDMASRANAEGMQDILKAQFAEYFNATEVPTGHNHCLNRLVGIRRYRDDQPCLWPPGNDHGALWKRNGKPYLYVYQPYQLLDETRVKLNKFCEQWNLQCLIHSFHAPSYYFWGRSTAIILLRKEKEGKL